MKKELIYLQYVKSRLSDGNRSMILYLNIFLAKYYLLLFEAEVISRCPDLKRLFLYRWSDSDGSLYGCGSDYAIYTKSSTSIYLVVKVNLPFISD